MIIRWLSLLTVTGMVLAASTGTSLAQRPRKEKKNEPEKQQEAPTASVEKPSSSSALKVAVIDLAKVFDNYNKKRDETVELEKQRSQMQSKLDGMEKELKKLEQEIEVLEGDEKLKKKAEFDDKKADYRAFYKINNTELLEKQCELWKTIYNDIIDQVKASAEKDGYDVVLKIDNGPVKGNSLEEIQLRVDIKKILYHSPRVDLTDAILNLLNEKYKRVSESKESSS